MSGSRSSAIRYWWRCSRQWCRRARLPLTGVPWGRWEIQISRRNSRSKIWNFKLFYFFKFRTSWWSLDFRKYLLLMTSRCSRDLLTVGRLMRIMMRERSKVTSFFSYFRIINFKFPNFWWNSDFFGNVFWQIFTFFGLHEVDELQEIFVGVNLVVGVHLVDEREVIKLSLSCQIVEIWILNENEKKTFSITHRALIKKFVIVFVLNSETLTLNLISVLRRWLWERVGYLVPRFSAQATMKSHNCALTTPRLWRRPF